MQRWTRTARQNVFARRAIMKIWSAPRIVDICVGCEINAYASAQL